jgi:hypothetical protein
MDDNNQEIKKSVSKTKLPKSVALLNDLKNNVIFFKRKAKLRVLMCEDVSKAKNLQDYEFVFSNITNSDKEPLHYTLKELIIRPRRIYLSISKNLRLRKSEIKVINWLKTNHILISIYLKKPVNNLEQGYIQNLEVKMSDLKKSKQEELNHFNSLSIKNIFGKIVVIPYEKVELISFEYNSVLIQLKSATSFSSRLGYKILKKIKPEEIVIT